jgi:hypothetical protein
LVEEVKEGKFHTSSYNKEIQSQFDGDYVKWYQTKVINEIKYLSLTFIYSESILNYKQNKNIQGKPVLSNNTNLSIDWDDTISQVKKDEETEINQNEFKFYSEPIEGINKDEFKFLWQKYNQSLS